LQRVAALIGPKVTSPHIVAIALSALGFCFVVFENSLGSVLGAVFWGQASASASQLSWLLAVPYVSGAVGAPVLGQLADRYGLTKLLAFTLLWLGPTSVAVAASPTLSALIAIRFLCGFALGAYPPLMFSYLTGVFPARRRGAMILLLVAGVSLAAPAGLLLVRWLTPVRPLGVTGWQWGFILCGVGSAVAGLLFLRLPRALSPLQESATPPSGEATVSKRVWLRFLVFFCVLQLLAPWATTAFPLLSGALWRDKGFAIPDTLVYLAISTVGATLGAALAALIADRVERRTTAALCATLMAASALTFAVARDRVWLIGSALAFDGLAILNLTVLNLYASESFPRRLRASSTATAWAMNRVSSVVAPLTLVPVLHVGGPFAMCAVIAGTQIASTLLIIAFGPFGATHDEDVSHPNETSTTIHTT
jgi:MFS transporter, putative metabolite:H+ symporter